ncbi:DUF6255 family natural product biosynthesis protein [Streptomyces sp. NPDC021100]|uniref:DUF6255 family natural product biosynthesis protein n=1 Tax=Streptomyces sp. NPDC021100 TaxID=3365114 RepID=UPI0037A661E5
MKVPCRHQVDGWTTSGGVLTCGGCGVRRIEDYAALGPAVEPPPISGRYRAGRSSPFRASCAFVTDFPSDRPT